MSGDDQPPERTENGLLMQQVASGVPGTVAKIVEQGLGQAGEDWERQQWVEKVYLAGRPGARVGVR